MPVRIGTISDMTAEEFEALRRESATRGNPEMDDLLTRVAAGRPQRVSLDAGQSARGLRVAIARAASQRGLTVETVEGDGFVAVTKVHDASPSRTRRAASSGNGRKQGRRSRQDADAAAGDEAGADPSLAEMTGVAP